MKIWEEKWEGKVRKSNGSSRRRQREQEEVIFRKKIDENFLELTNDINLHIQEAL